MKSKNAAGDRLGMDSFRLRQHYDSFMVCGQSFGLFRELLYARRSK